MTDPLPRFYDNNVGWEFCLHVGNGKSFGLMIGLSMHVFGNDVDNEWDGKYLVFKPGYTGWKCGLG